jgi:hypothetical protein
MSIYTIPNLCAFDNCQVALTCDEAIELRFQLVSRQLQHKKGWQWVEEIVPALLLRDAHAVPATGQDRRTPRRQTLQQEFPLNQTRGHVCAPLLIDNVLGNARTRTSQLGESTGQDLCSVDWLAIETCVLVAAALHHSTEQPTSICSVVVTQELQAHGHGCRAAHIGTIQVARLWFCMKHAHFKYHIGQ